VFPARVRQARLEAGLSLADVAGHQVSRAAIHLNETGQSRPSIRTLRLIATRTKKPLSYFLAGEIAQPPKGTTAGKRSPMSPASMAATDLEHVALTNDPAGLHEAAQKELEAASNSRERAFAHFYLGRAELQLSQPQAALENFRSARNLFEQVRDPWMAVECMDWEAGALRSLERADALAVAREALRRCQQLKPRPTATEVRILGHIGSIHVFRHEWTQAIEWYERAVETAGSIRDLNRVARMYQDLSLAYQEIGDLNQAAAYSHKALALYEMERNQQAVAFAENDLALILIKQGQLDAADRHLRDSLATFDELGLKRSRSHVLLSFSDLETARGAHEEAEAYARSAADLANDMGEQMTAALAHQVLGKLATRRADHDRADREFSIALSTLSKLGAVERLLECHASYADVLEGRGDHEAAVRHLKAAVALARPHALPQAWSDRAQFARPAESNAIG
jgi:tetratricopeptide (TPR) repeat protein